MNAFDEALDQFHRNGCFIYKSACLNTDHITKLKDSLAELDLSNTYQFHLSDVRLDPYTTQPTVAPVLRRQSTRTSRSNSSSSSEDASGSSAFAERIAAFEQFNTEQAEAKFSLSRNEFADELLSVLKSGLIWSSIEIEGVYFQQGQEKKDYLSASFHRPLLSHLTRHDSLTRLSLDPFFLSEGGVSLGNFLTGNVNLQDLSLGIKVGKLLDWENLGLKLAAHRRLKQANFKNTALNNANCSGLITLARNNYKTDIIFPELQLRDERKLDIKWREEYQALTDRLKVYKNTPEQRFKKECLSEASILKLATKTLVKINSVQKITYGASLHDSAGPKAKLAEGAVRTIGQLIDTTVNEAQLSDRRLERNQNKDANQNQEKRALTLFAYLIGAQDPETIRHSEEAYQVLPKVYQDNREHLDDHLSLLKLNLNNPHPDRNQSIAGFLLDKVYQIGNTQALQRLLDAKVNVFEPVTGVQEAFLVKAFKNNDQNMRPFRQALLEHIIQDDDAMEEIEKQLEAYNDLLIPYQSLIRHLKRYTGILQRREEDSVINQLIAVLKSGLVFIWKEDTAAKRPEEFAEIKYHLKQSIQSIIGSGNEGPGSNEFQTARECFEKMLEISENAKKGHILGSNLHDTVKEYSKKLITQVNIIQNQFINQYKGEADTYKTKYDEIAEKQTELQKEHEQKMKDMKAEADAEIKKMKDMQAKAKAREDQADARQAAADAEIKKLRELMARMGLPQNQAAASDSEIAATSYSFFPARR
ncbi:MAG: hypothetical protein WCE22_01615 [Candidatus Aquirickettsiella gammari]